LKVRQLRECSWFVCLFVCLACSVCLFDGFVLFGFDCLFGSVLFCLHRLFYFVLFISFFKMIFSKKSRKNPKQKS